METLKTVFVIAFSFSVLGLLSSQYEDHSVKKARDLINVLLKKHHV
jgi:hypothetical protein